MNKIIFSLLSFLTIPVIGYAQIVKTLHIHVSPESFTLSQRANGRVFIDAKPSFSYAPSTPLPLTYSYNGVDYKEENSDSWFWEETFDSDGGFLPNILWRTVSMPLEKGESYDTYTMEETDSLIAEDIVLDHAPVPIPRGNDAETNDNDVVYSKDIYPDHNIRYIDESGVGIYSGNVVFERTLWVNFSPFRYDAANKKLYLLTDITLNIILMQTDAEAIQHVEAEVSPNEGNIFDLSGRRLSSIPAKGMYIQSGKKKILK